MNNYYNKYLKYKKKYLELSGGNLCRANKTVEDCNADKNCIYTNKKECIKKNVYIPYLHSCHLDEVKKIPPGSILVNTSSCGFTTAYHEHVENTLRQMFMEKDEKLKDPSGNREYIEQKLKFPISIHTSTENSNYLDMSLSYHLIAEYDSSLDKEKKNRLIQLCSGLYSIDGGLCNFNVSLGQNEINRDQIIKVYENSVFPTREDILDLFGSKKQLSIGIFEQKLKEKYGELKLSTLLEKFPGVYYFMACRPPCSEIIFDITKNQRKLSISNLSEENQRIEKETMINRYIFEFKKDLEEEIHITYLNEIIKDYIENYGYNKFIEDLKSYLRTKNKELKNLNIKLDNTLKLLKQEIKIETGRSKLKQKKIEREKLIERRTNNIKTIELYKELIKKIKLYTELIK
jgi:hypothetical protein